jgi:6-phosphogluconate dehydrogenase
MLEAVAATAKDGALCVDRFGDGGAGHFVKMVHNGIEYAIMQAIAEAHMLLTRGAGIGADEVAAILSRWNAGRGAGFLLEITAEIANAPDPLGGGILLDRIGDAAGQKGTGGWTVEAALEHGVAIPSIMEAVTARQISGEASARAIMAAQNMPHGPIPRDGLEDALESALTGTMLAALAQGVHLYAVAARANGWDTDLARVLRVWRAGSILRMDLLDTLATRVTDDPLPLAVPDIARDMAALVPAWRRVAGAAIGAGYPVPVLAGTLSYVEALATNPLPTAVVQAQRDRFGAHGFARTDRECIHHGPWVHPDTEEGA